MGNKEIFLYRIRLPGPLQPEDLLCRMTHAAWRTLADALGERNPHKWTKVFGALRRALGGQLVSYPGCGATHDCRSEATPVFPDCPRENAGPLRDYFIRWSADDDPDLVRRLRTEVLRSFHGELAGADPHQREHLEEALQRQLIQSLAPYLWASTPCQTCPAREGVEERRIFPIPDNPLLEAL